MIYTKVQWSPWEPGAFIWALDSRDGRIVGRWRIRNK
jgi:hypothetical protein